MLLMKKCASLFIISFCFMVSARSQEEFGYKTIDVGGEFQSYYRGYTAALHLAYNFPIHHGIQLKVGYNKSNWKDAGLHDNEDGGGPVFSLGYRYYFLVRPHGFFLGAHADVRERPQMAERTERRAEAQAVVCPAELQPPPQRGAEVVVVSR